MNDFRRRPQNPTPDPNTPDSPGTQMTPGLGSDDGIRAVLTEAARQQRCVVLALVDGTRLNGTPLPDRAAPTCPGVRLRCSGRFEFEGTVRLLEGAGTEPFVVRLAHVLYVRLLGTDRPTP